MLLFEFGFNVFTCISSLLIISHQLLYYTFTYSNLMIYKGFDQYGQI